PYGIVISPNGNRAYVANYGGTVSVIDTATNSIIDSINVGPAVGIAISPDGCELYVTHYRSSNTVTVIDTSTDSVAGTVTVGRVPEYPAILVPSQIEPTKTPLSFSGAVATFYETDGSLVFYPSQMIDGNFTSYTNGWAIYRDNGSADQTQSETALLTLSAPLAAGGYYFTFNLFQVHRYPCHVLGDFSLGYATDSSPTLTSTETPFTIIGASSLNGTTFTFPAQGQILAGGPVPATDVYTITVDVNSARPITGIFLNAIDDPNN